MTKLRGDCDLDLDNGDSGGIVLIFTGKRTHAPGIVIITLPDNVQASLKAFRNRSNPLIMTPLRDNRTKVLPSSTQGSQKPLKVYRNLGHFSMGLLI